MKAGVVVFHPDGTGAVFEVRKGPSVCRLQKLLGGYIEIVPYWETFRDRDGRSCPARAFCNEDGKRLGLSPNELATAVWRVEAGPTSDYLAGNVVVVFGTREFLQEWDDSL